MAYILHIILWVILGAALFGHLGIIMQSLITGFLIVGVVGACLAFMGG